MGAGAAAVAAQVGIAEVVGDDVDDVGSGHDGRRIRTPGPSVKSAVDGFNSGFSMDPRHLVQLATILAHGSISKASQHLHLTQPTLTHNMQVLEMQVGGKLFDRSRFGVRPTPLGEMLAREGRAIVRRMEDARGVSARHRTGLRGTVRLGAGPLIGAAVLPRITAALLRQLPDIHVSVQSDRPHLLVDQLVDGQHDLVIAPSWLDQPPPGFERFLLARDDLGVFCGTSHPLAATGMLAPGASHAHSWISLGTSSPFDKAVRDMLEEVGVGTPRTEISVLGDSFMLLQMLALGAHLAVLPRYPVRLLQHRFAITELALPVASPPRNIYLWCKATLLDDPVFGQIKDAVLAVAADAPAGAGAGRSAEK
ncbi:MAG: LysR family transcriptional regulator [Comamonadaceae bacterium]|nr:MAG: LysR family transcriptional regulator [Comamonadaceae bacterium]